MEGPTCGFCHEGKSSELICGPLFTSERCSAHYKCMQYSSCLVQYKSKEFGGFKVKKVLAEIARGRRLSCFICKKKYGGSKKFKLLARGASAGCAHAACSRTFHFPCAAKGEEVMTKRIETVDKETQQTAVLYRIFCSKKHQNQFEKASKAEMEITYNSCSSDSELGTDTESHTRDSDSDSSSSDESDADLPKKSLSKTSEKASQSLLKNTSENSSRPSNSKENLGERPTELKRPLSEEAKGRVSVNLVDTEASDIKKQRGSVCQAELDDSPSRSSLVRQDEDAESAQMEHCQDAVTRSEERYASKRVRSSRRLRRKQNGSRLDPSVNITALNQRRVSPTPSQTVKSAKKRNLIDADDSGSSSEDLFDPKPVGIVHRIRADRSTSDSKKQKFECRAKAAVCLMQDWQTREKLNGCAKLYVQNEFGIPESGVHLWHPSIHNLTYEHMLYYMKDVAKCITNCNTDELTDLIFNFTSEYLEKYDQCIHVAKEYMDRELQDCINQKVWDTTLELFRQKRDDLKMEVGEPVILHKLECIFLVVLLTDDIDPNGSIRQALEDEGQHVYEVDLSTELIGTHAIKSDRLKANELQTLKLWLEKQLGENPVYGIRPHETIMRQPSLASVTCLLCKVWQEKFRGRPRKPTVDEMSSVVLFIVPVDPEIVAPTPYIRKLVPSFLVDELPKLNSAYCIFDVAPLDGIHSSLDIVPSLPPDVSMTVYSGVNPKISRPSCLVLHFTTT